MTCVEGRLARSAHFFISLMLPNSLKSRNKCEPEDRWLAWVPDPRPIANLLIVDHSTLNSYSPTAKLFAELTDDSEVSKLPTDSLRTGRVILPTLS